MSVLSRFPGLPRHLKPVLRPLARWMPPLAVVHHQGRRSGKAFETPVQAFRTDTGFIIGLSYTNHANWALNLLAASGGEISRGGHRYTLSQPRRRGADARDNLPAPISYVMRTLGIDEFIQCDATRKP
jgi:deazaflavin-dependent oxidoreductase (nitroreductase family)